MGKKIGIIVGTRPEIIKMSPIIRILESNHDNYCLIHTNQHYSSNMDQVFFEQLELPKPHYNLDVGSGLHGEQTAKMLTGIEKILINEKIDIVLVQGDTNSVLAGALAASKLNIKVGHVEAGLRSYDNLMPEEKNRIITDHISDYMFAVSPLQENILLSEGIDKTKIFVVGNTIVDSLNYAKRKAETMTCPYGDFYLVTAHRPSNVDNKECLKELCAIFQNLNKKVIWPIHPRTNAKIKNLNITLPSNVKLTDPIGYFEFINLMINSNAILTDSGGLQEEACILHVPCITLRENTERPESVKVGSNFLVGRSWDKVSKALEHFSAHKRDWKNPFGDGTAALQILKTIL